MTEGRTPARTLYESLSEWAALEQLIADGEAEGKYLECKAPSSPQIGQELRGQASRAASAFSNSGGGVLVWGMSTSNRVHTGLDVLTQLEPIGHIKQFEQRFSVLLPRLTNPALRGVEAKVIKASPRDSKGVLLSLFDGTSGDPFQAADGKFYVRVAAENNEMPYEVIRRMFAGAAGPDLYVNLDGRLVIEENGYWTIPVVLENSSSAAARDVSVTVVILNPEACEQVTGMATDLSAVNPGQMIFGSEIAGPIHRGMGHVAGSVRVMMKTQKRKKRVLRMRVNVLADRMRGKYWEITVQLAQTGFSIRGTKDDYIY